MNYFARSEIDTEDILSPTTADYILAFYIAGFIAVILFAFVLLWIYYVKSQWNVRLKMLSKRIERNKYGQSKIFSIAFTAGILMIYMFTLDIFAVYTLKDKPAILQTRNIDENVLPYVVLSYDILLVLVWLCCFCPSCGMWCVTRADTNYGDKESYEYTLLAISTVSPILIFVIHVPYVAIAYLNDVSHATSMFIYYTVVAFVIFGILDLSHGTYVRILLRSKKRDICGCPSNEEAIHRRSLWGVLCFTMVTLLLIGMITAALVTIPISKAFTDTSNRLLGFYQTALVLIGAYLFYRSAFKKETTLESEVEKRVTHIKQEGNDAHWQALSKHQKLAKVYSHMLDILADYEFKTPQQLNDSNTTTSLSSENSRSNDIQMAQIQKQDQPQSDPPPPQQVKPNTEEVEVEVYPRNDQNPSEEPHQKEQETEATPLLKNLAKLSPST